MSNLNLSDLPLIVHSIKHLKTLDPEYFNCSKNLISDLFSHLDPITQLEVINNLSEILLESLTVMRKEIEDEK